MTKMERIEHLEIEVAKLRDELDALRRDGQRPVNPSVPAVEPWPWRRPYYVTCEPWGRMHA